MTHSSPPQRCRPSSFPRARARAPSASALSAALQEKAAGEAETKRLATNLDASKKLAAAGSLSEARDAFKILSRKASHLAEGLSGTIGSSARTCQTTRVSGYRPARR